MGFLPKILSIQVVYVFFNKFFFNEISTILHSKRRESLVVSNPTPEHYLQNINVNNELPFPWLIPHKLKTRAFFSM